ncbi:hypothetical protein PDJAM_G00031350 [Pangasius djambal]|uniref:Uncharacterized protein n=1 Tax=Pangasius djambal TaxID=1691987 RepID=A0ACC5YSR6_9TELE|nr:hypothetical protein [Pangasius djambal]
MGHGTPFGRDEEKTAKSTIQQVWLPGLNHFVVKPSPPYRPFLRYFYKHWFKQL